MFPEEFTQRMNFMLGEEYDDFLSGFSHTPSKALRFNPCKTADGARPDIPFHLTGIDWEENGYCYDETDELGKSALHMAGLYYIQEPSAMAPVSYLAPQPGDRVLDLCAAPGGKSTQIAGRMGGKGILVTNEISAARAKILSENMERLGTSNALVLNETSEHLAERFEGWFDRILVDAPCSGEGMFRKNEEAVSNWTPENVQLCADRQDEIIDNAAAMLAENGRLVYSTCTFAPDEDEGTIYRFLLRHPEFEVAEVPLYKGMDHGNPAWARVRTMDPTSWTVSENREEVSAMHLERCIRLWPHHLSGEGHFLAVLQRKEAGEPGAETEITYCPGGFQKGIALGMAAVEKADGAAEKSRKDIKKDKAHGQKAKERRNQGRQDAKDAGRDLAQALSLWNAFAEDNLTPSGIARINGTLFTFGDNVYLAPSLMPCTDHLKVMRPGLHLGMMKKDRFEPSHSLALFLRKEDAKRVQDYPFDSSFIRDFTTGLSLSQKGENGWYLITTSGCSIGWAKCDGTRMKNHYPRGLRINYD